MSDVDHAAPIARATEPLVLVGGTIHDPATGRDGVVEDLFIADGRIVAPPPQRDRVAFRRIDVRGLVVMPGGVDLHSHVAGPKVCAGRRMSPHLTRRGPVAAVPTIHATGRLYAALGYTTVFDAAIASAAARIAHAELSDLPIVDRGIYLLLADDEPLLKVLASGDRRDAARMVTEGVRAGGGWGVKVANPGGAIWWKRGRRGDHRDLDEVIPDLGLSGRSLLERLQAAVELAALPHPLHVHTVNLGLPGNWRSTRETMRALEAGPAHLAHVQFHSYTGGDEDPDTFGSGVEPLVERFAAQRSLTLDVGQILFGDTVAMTGDSAAAEHLAHTTGAAWCSHDLHLEGGCGILPIRYRERSLVHAWQWAIGLEWFLSVDDPWRIVLSTDHPNGAHFSAYPLLMRLLGDEPFRREAFARIHPAVRRRSPLAGLSREYSLQELVTITRSAPAPIPGLPHKGSLAIGADADIAVHRPGTDLATMFSVPAWVFKAGRVVVEDGEIRDERPGEGLFAQPDTRISSTAS